MFHQKQWLRLRIWVVDDIGTCYSFDRNCLLPCFSWCFRHSKPRCNQFQAAKQILLDSIHFAPSAVVNLLSACLPIEGFVHWRGRGTTAGRAVGKCTHIRSKIERVPLAADTFIVIMQVGTTCSDSLEWVKSLFPRKYLFIICIQAWVDLLATSSFSWQSQVTK